MSTRLIRSLVNFPPECQGGVLTIGNFDGVHRGHQQLLRSMIKEAARHGGRSTVMTFEPHPFEFFSKENLTIPRITRMREKFIVLAAEGVSHVIILPFKQELADISASEFVELIAQHIRPSHVIVGDDFRFGKKRQGDFALLQELGKQLGFSVAAMPTYEMSGERVSSTRVRKALIEGDHELVNRLLGRPYTMQGRVQRGEQLGRKLGFPTANIFVHRRLTAVSGIYVVYMHGIYAAPMPGVAYVGTRPSVDGTRTVLEVHLLDFNQDIYGRHVEVEFVKKIRDDARFESLDLLQKQIANDVHSCRDYFKQQERK